MTRRSTAAGYLKVAYAYCLPITATDYAAVIELIAGCETCRR